VYKALEETRAQYNAALTGADAMPSNTAAVGSAWNHSLHHHDSMPAASTVHFPDRKALTVPVEQTAHMTDALSRLQAENAALRAAVSSLARRVASADEELARTRVNASYEAEYALQQAQIQLQQYVVTTVKALMSNQSILLRHHKEETQSSTHSGVNGFGVSQAHAEASHEEDTGSATSSSGTAGLISEVNRELKAAENNDHISSVAGMALSSLSMPAISAVSPARPGSSMLRYHPPFQPASDALHMAEPVAVQEVTGVGSPQRKPRPHDRPRPMPLPVSPRTLHAPASATASVASGSKPPPQPSSILRRLSQASAKGSAAGGNSRAKPHGPGTSSRR
jgi:hypothetical protein